METTALSFERGWILQALWLLPLVIALFWWAENRRRTALGRIVAPKLRAVLAGNTSPVRRWFRSACVVLALALLVVSLAGPRLGYDTIEVPHRGRDVIIAMDVSRSMLTPDVVPSRLDRAKLLAQDLISELGSDRIGLVAFAGSAFLQAPLTLDHGAVLVALDELDTSVIPKGGSNIAEAIGTAEQAFGKAEGFSRAIVVMSDGEELSADAVSAAKDTAAAGIKIFTVGIGSTEGAEIPDGAGDFVHDPDTGKIVHSKLDEKRLEQIAAATGGFYTRLGDDAATKLSTEGIGRMAESDITESSSRRPIERYQWPLAAAIGLLMLQAMIGERRRRAAVVLLMLLPVSGWSAPAGIEAYEKGDYEKARDVFERRLGWEPDSPLLQLNAGTAAYRLKDYEKAAQYFSGAALSADDKIRSDAEFSFGNTLFRRGEAEQDKEKKKADWKQAIAKYDAALKTRPGYTEAKENKARIEELLKQLEEQQKQDQQKQDQQDRKQDQQQKDEKQDQQEQQKQDQQQQQKQDQQQKDQQQQQQQQGGAQKDEQGQEEQKQQNQSGSGGGSDQQEQEQQKQDQQKKEQDQAQGGSEKKEDKSEQDKQEQSGSGQRDQQKQQQQQQGGGQKDEQQKEQQGRGEEKQQEPETGEKEGQQQQQSGQSGSQQSPPQDQRDERGPMPQQPQEKKEGELRGGEASPEKKSGEQAGVVGEKVEEGKMSEGQARALLRSLQNEEDKINLHEQAVFQEVSKDW